ncbi:MAG: thermonuclease family protein [Candidatus Aenigmarchaeota archaeon]|nr:thermonuclease family protein [Candidatus Aenigmarchaeota archaeon]
MENKLKILLIVLIVFLLAAASGYTGYYLLTRTQENLVNVTQVFDGDTIEIETGEKVRLLGINTPEKSEAHYQEAKDRLSELVGGRQVKLERTNEDKDKYGRLLRYVFVGDDNINVIMLDEGYATLYVFTPDKYYSELKNAEMEARESVRGLWSVRNEICIEVVNFNYNAVGNDNENLNDEYVIFRNICKSDVNMVGWIAKDEGTNIYTFKNFTVKEGSGFTLFSGKGTDSNDELYWSSRLAVWNNAGDTLFLRDGEGNLVLSYSYP